MSLPSTISVTYDNPSGCDESNIVLTKDANDVYKFTGGGSNLYTTYQCAASPSGNWVFQCFGYKGSGSCPTNLTYLQVGAGPTGTDYEQIAGTGKAEAF